MKKLRFAYVLVSIIALIILACTNKEIKLVTNVNLDFDQEIIDDGFVNELLPSTIIITPEAFLPEFEYYFSYEVLDGQGVFINSDETELPANENIILVKEETETNFTLNIQYKGLSSGNHRIKVTAGDNFDKKITAVLNYTIKDIPVVWTATTPTDQVVLGDTTLATITLQNNINTPISFERSYTFAQGSGQLLDTSGATIQLGQTEPITPGVYQITIAPTQLGTNSINFNLEDSNGQQLVATITLTVVEENTNLPPTATITATPSTGTAPLNVQFTANATDPNSDDTLSYNWDFGDGNTSTEANPIHQYLTASTTPYNVTLTVSDGTDDGTATTTITVNTTTSTNTPPTVTIAADPTSGNAPLTTNFTATVTDPDDGAVFTYNWDFGDGNTSTEANPTHQYLTASTTPYNVTLTVSDGTDDGTATTTITVNTTTSTNTPPTVTIAADPTNGNAPLTTNFTATVTDPDDGAVFTYNWDFGDGNTSTEANPTHQYLTASTTPYNVTLTVSDGTDDGTATTTITVNTPNASPTAVDDNVSTTLDKGISILVLDNDTDPENDPLIITDTSSPNNGTTMLSGPGISYQPNSGFTGQDTFTYTINDGTTGNNATATVTVLVNPPPNTAPIAIDDTATATQGDAINISVLSNDSDPDAGDILSIDSVSNALNGTATDNGNGTIRYVSNPTYQGNDTFNYTITDGNLTATASVTIEVSPPDTELIITSDTNSGIIPFSVNFSSNEDPTRDITFKWDFGDGNTSTEANPRHEYTSDGSFTVTLEVLDEISRTTSNSITITASAALNQLPTAIINLGLSEGDGAPDLLNFDARGSSDSDGTIVEYQWDFGDPTSTDNTSTKTDDSTIGHTYNTPGNYTVTLIVIDNDGGTNTTTESITITEANRPPVAKDISRNVSYNASIKLTIPDLASDPDIQDTLIIKSIEPLITENGSSTIETDTETNQQFIQYNAPTNGADKTISFNFVVEDTKGNTATGTITINLIDGLITNPDCAEKSCSGGNVWVACNCRCGSPQEACQ